MYALAVPLVPSIAPPFFPTPLATPAPPTPIRPPESKMQRNNLTSGPKTKTQRHNRKQTHTLQQYTNQLFKTHAPK